MPHLSGMAHRGRAGQCGRQRQIAALPVSIAQPIAIGSLRRRHRIGDRVARRTGRGRPTCPAPLDAARSCSECAQRIALPAHPLLESAISRTSAARCMGVASVAAGDSRQRLAAQGEPLGIVVMLLDGHPASVAPRTTPRTHGELRPPAGARPLPGRRSVLMCPWPLSHARHQPLELVSGDDVGSCPRVERDHLARRHPAIRINEVSLPPLSNHATANRLRNPCGVSVPRGAPARPDGPTGTDRRPPQRTGAAPRSSPSAQGADARSVSGTVRALVLLTGKWTTRRSGRGRRPSRAAISPFLQPVSTSSTTMA